MSLHSLLTVLLILLIQFTGYSQCAPEFFKRGIENYKLGKHQEALDNYSKALAEDTCLPYNNIFYSDVYWSRGITYSDLNEFSNAIKDFDNSIKLDSAKIPAFVERAETKTKIKDYPRSYF